MRQGQKKREIKSDKINVRNKKKVAIRSAGPQKKMRKCENVKMSAIAMETDAMKLNSKVCSGVVKPALPFETRTEQNLH